MALAEEFNTIIKNKLPLKLMDPESFLIPYVIGTISFEKALCDLGAIVSLIPLSIYGKFDIGRMKPTSFSLKLVG